MKPTQISELRAFVFSLDQLEESLPEDVQTKINQVNISIDVDQLDDIAMSYQPLANIYQQVLGLLHNQAEYRSKGVDDIPQNQPEARNAEVDNVSVEVERKLVEFEEKVDNKQLTKIAVTMTMAKDSVKAVKDGIKKLLS